jgi:hypothetical protein
VSQHDLIKVASLISLLKYESPTEKPDLPLMSTEPGEAKPPGDGVLPSVSRGRACTYMVTAAIRLRGLGPVIYRRGTLVRRIR